MASVAANSDADIIREKDEMKMNIEMKNKELLQKQEVICTS